MGSMPKPVSHRSLLILQATKWPISEGRLTSDLWVESAFLLGGSLRVSYIVTLSLEISNLVNAKVHPKFFFLLVNSMKRNLTL